MWLENILCIILLFKNFWDWFDAPETLVPWRRMCALLLMDGGFCGLVRSFWFILLFTISLSLGSVFRSYICYWKENVGVSSCCCWIVYFSLQYHSFLFLSVPLLLDTCMFILVDLSDGLTILSVFNVSQFLLMFFVLKSVLIHVSKTTSLLWL